MKQIRQGTFETNSSSMHSLVIKSEDCMNENGGEVIETSETIAKAMRYSLRGSMLDISWADCSFGRYPFQVLYKFIDKYLYACTMYKLFDPDHMNVLEDILKKYLPQVTKIKYPKDMSADEPYLFEWMGKYNISLEEFLTNNKYIVINDGDERQIWNSLRSLDIINKNALSLDSQEEI